MQATSLALTAGLRADQIDLHLKQANRLADVGQRALAFYLAELDTRGLCQVLGFPSAVAYAIRVLGMSRRTARELVRVGRRLEILPRLDQAFANGLLTWSKVRRLARVAAPETEQQWLDATRTATQDEVERMTRGVREGDPPPTTAGLPGARFKVSIELDALQWQMWENAREKLAAETGFESDVKDIDVLMEMVRLVLASDADGSVPGRKTVDGSLYKVVVQSSDDVRSGSTVEGEDGAVALETTAFDVAASDAQTPPSLRRKVFARDGHRCRHCRARRDLHAHHVVWRSRGGATTLANLVTLCRRCHGMVHDGFLGVEAAPRTTSERGVLGFRFYDMHDEPLDRWRIVAPRVEKHAAQGAMAPPSPPGTIDAKWLADHLDWFHTRGGKLTVKPAYRERALMRLGNGDQQVPA